MEDFTVGCIGVIVGIAISAAVDLLIAQIILWGLGGLHVNAGLLPVWLIVIGISLIVSVNSQVNKKS